MGREWMQCKKTSAQFKDGIKEFLEFAFSEKNVDDVMPCPCVTCNNARRKTKDQIELDLRRFGIVKSYTRWLHHGEKIDDYITSDSRVHESVHDTGDDSMFDMVHEALGKSHIEGEAEGSTTSGPCDLTEQAANFYKLMGNLELELYPGCKGFSKLSFLLKLFHIKCLGGISDKSLAMILKLFKEALPEGNSLPETYYEAQKIVQDLSLESTKIDACTNNCMLFWKEHVNAEECVKCHASRWKESGNSGDTSESKPRKIPCKTIRYFPLIPRLQRIFMSSKTTSSMRWHHDERLDDGVMRHPADSKAWKHFDELYPSFASEPRNVRLGLASDGFSPFRNGHISHSTWPVVLIPYNLPPWLCMKQHSVILSTLIPGPHGPKDKLDVFLQPLIDELKLLWEDGVMTYDASLKKTFKMHASLLWTISDFPAYGDLSGWRTSEEFACPSCNSNTCSDRLHHGNKECYLGHRRFLPHDHTWRKDTKNFNGKEELRSAPKVLSGEEVLHQIHVQQAASNSKKRKKKKRGDKDNLWRKRSIFFELPYWSSLLIRHNLDVMHIEKNVCEALLRTLLDIDKKSKDNYKARLDLKEMKIRKSLHPITHPNGTVEIPPAPHTLSLEQKQNLCNFLSKVKFPDGYASNISKNVLLKERKLSGLKSHDYHVIMEHLLPLAIRGWPKNLAAPLIQLSTFFKELCSKTLQIHELKQLEKQIVITLCELEKIFPPSFFVISMHLPIHLATEALIGGPVHYRWMYPIERYLCKLKGYVRNRSHPEGSIAEGYILEECLTFCSRYMEDIETRFNLAERNSDTIHRPSSTCDSNSVHNMSIFNTRGRPLGKSTPRLLTTKEWEDAHFYVLNNCDEVQPFIQEYDNLARNGGRMVSSHNRNFIQWFRDRVTTLSKENHPSVNKNLLALAHGPDRAITSVNGYIVNGFVFHTKDLQRVRQTQNSGVAVKGEVGTSNLEYYGVVQEIIELQYIEGNRVVLFRCDWWDVYSQGTGIVIDYYEFTSVNTVKVLTSDPYIFGSQAQQVFYVDDVVRHNWQVVIKTKPRNLFDVPEQADDVDDTYS